MAARPGGSAPEDSSGTRETGRGRGGSSVVDAEGPAGYGGPTSWRIRRQSRSQTVTVGNVGGTLGRSERGGWWVFNGRHPSVLPRAETGGRGAWRRGSGMKLRPGGGQGGFEASGIGLEKEGQPSSPWRGGQKGKGMRTGEPVAAGSGRSLSCPPFLVTPFLTFLTFMGETCELSRCSLCRLTRGLCGVRLRLCHWGPLFTREGGWWVSVLPGSTAGRSVGSPGTAG